jgi:hypothetical protein
MGKFTVYQSNKYITSLKLRSRGPCRVAATQWGLVVARPLIRPATRNQKRQTLSIQYVPWTPLRRSWFPFANQDWTFAQFRRLTSKATIRSGASRGEINERPIRGVYPIAAGDHSGPCSQVFARRSRRADNGLPSARRIHELRVLTILAVRKL